MAACHRRKYACPAFESDGSRRMGNGTIWLTRDIASDSSSNDSRSVTILISSTVILQQCQSDSYASQGERTWYLREDHGSLSHSMNPMRLP